MIGAWHLDPITRRLSKGDVVRTLEPKMVDLLLLLAQRPGELFERSHLERTIWSAAAVGSDSLNRTIWKLRQVLGDDPSDPEFIETIPRRGYRLIAPVREPEEESPPPAAASGFGNRTRAGWVGLVAIGAIAGIVVAPRLSSPGQGVAAVVSPRPLTAAQGYESNPAVDLSGGYVAYQSYDPTVPDASWDVMVADLTDGTTTALSSADGAHEYAPTWSFSGDSVAYVRSDDRCLVMVQARDGPPVEAFVCDPDQWHDLAWLPSGDMIVASTVTGQTSGLVRVSRPTGRRENLTTPPNGFESDWLPRVSPQGDRVAFLRRSAANIGDIYVLELNVDGAVPRRVTDDHRSIRGLTWEPSGRTLLFTSPRGGNNQVWRVSVDGGSSPEPAGIPGRQQGAISSAVGAVVYEDYRGESDLWMYDPESGRVERWYGSSRSEWGAAVSPDGGTVAFVSDRTGSYEIWISDVDLDAPRQLTRLDGAPLDPPRWSQDGRSLVYSSASRGIYDIFSIDVATGSIEQVTDSPENERFPTWWGGSVVYSANRTGSPELWTTADAGDIPTRLTRGGGWMAKPNPANQSLFLTRPDQPGVWQLTAPGNVVLADPALGPAEGSSWEVHGSEVLFLQAGERSSTELVSRQRGSSRDSVLARIEGEFAPTMGVSRLPDGRILFGAVVRSESDLWIVR